MLAGGEDRLFLARRLVRAAVEDVGLADPRALTVALAAKEAFHFLGEPEGDLALAEAAIYLASAPKSNKVYEALGKAVEEAERTSAESPPLHILNAPTPLMKTLGYGRGYEYPPDAPEGVVAAQYLPDALCGRRFYEPGSTGYENEIAKRLAEWAALKDRLREPPPGDVAPTRSPREDTPP
jgi:putative ATPase